MPTNELNRMPTRAVFLDRDGVVNQAVVRNGKPYPPQSVEDMEVAPDAVESLAALRKLNYLLLVVTNQPDVSRGKQDRASVEKIHSVLQGLLPLDDFFVCYHDDEDGCDCRKPKPGLLRQAVKKYSVELKESYLIGDRWRDIDAGQAAGCKTIWIDRGYLEKGPAHPPDARVTSLAEAVAYIQDCLDSESSSASTP